MVKSTGKVWIFFDTQSEKQSKPLSTVQAQVLILKIKTMNPHQFLIWTPGWNEWQPLPHFLNSNQSYFVLAPQPHPSSPQQNSEWNSGNEEPTLVILNQDDADKSDEATEITNPDSFIQSNKTKTFTKSGFTKTKTNTSAGDSKTDFVYTKVEVDDRPYSEVKKDNYGYFYDDFNADKLDPEAKHELSFKIPSKKPSGKDRRIDQRHNLKIEVLIITKNGRSFRTTSENISMGGTLLEDELPKEFLNLRFSLILINKFERDPKKSRIEFQGRIVGDFANPRRLMFIDADEVSYTKLKNMLKSYAHAQKTAKSKVSG